MDWGLETEGLHYGHNGLTYGFGSQSGYNFPLQFSMSMVNNREMWIGPTRKVPNPVIVYTTICDVVRKYRNALPIPTRTPTPSPSLTLTRVPTPPPSPSGLVVNISSGLLQGALTPAGHHRLFLGIPYAAPPLGDLRFRPPRRVAPWSGIRNASKYGNTCISRYYGWKTVQGWPGSDDCLYLNVVAPVNLGPSGKLPVMAYIHAGEFVFGSAHDLESDFPGMMPHPPAITHASPFTTHQCLTSHPSPLTHHTTPLTNASPFTTHQCLASHPSPII